MSHHKIEMRKVSYTYPDGNTALEDVSFIIGHGQSVGVLGANGAGKSTLLLLLMGVLCPASGEILIGDVKMTPETLPDIRKRLGLVFQNPDDQLFMNTIYEDVAFGPRNARLSEQEVDKRVTEALQTVGIPHLKNRAPYRCSGGEKRAAAIAGVLAMQSDVLILDEPTSDLDPKARRRTMELLQSFTHTKIIASHDIDMVYELCGRTIILQNGRITVDGDTREVVTNASLMERSGLEPPMRLQGCPVCGKTNTRYPALS